MGVACLPSATVGCALCAVLALEGDASAHLRPVRTVAVPCGWRAVHSVPLSVVGVARIKRLAVLTYRCAEAARVVSPFGVMARLTQTSEWAAVESVDVTFVWREVIDDSCRAEAP
jgi:hypothetical protein